MVPGQMKDFSQSLVAVSLFSSNLLFWKESGYFDAASEEKPLLHTWSLSVEEQYYFLFPIFLFLIWRFGKNRVFWTIFLIALISLVFSEWSWRNKNSANFFLAPSRAWEILAGSISAFIVKKRGVCKNELISLFGLFCIITPFILYDQKTPFPSIYTLVPVVGVVLVIIYADQNTLVSKFLSTKLLVGLGLISYSAYLWHQPLFAFARIRFLNEPSNFTKIIIIIFSLILAFLSWKLIERPFRSKEKISKKNILLLTIFPLIFFIIFGLTGHLNFGYEKRFSKDFVLTLKNSSDRDQNSNQCFLKPEETSKIPSHPISSCMSYFVNNSASVLMIGDSHLDTMGSLIQKELYDLGIGSYSVSYPGCPPFSGLYGINEKKNHKCHEYNKSMLEYAKSNNIEDIILIAAFPAYLEGKLYDNGEGGKVRGTYSPHDDIRNKNQITIDNSQRLSRVSKIFSEQLSTLSSDYRIFLFTPVPEVGWEVPKYYAHQAMFKKSKSETFTHKFDNYKLRTLNFMNIVKSIDSKNFYMYDISELLCNKDTQRCTINHGNDLLYRDDNHLSMYAAEIVAKDFINKFSQILLKQNN